MRRFLVVLTLAMPAAQADEPVALPSGSGQTGLISMPDARMAPDGTWRTGYSFLRPYHALWSSLTAMPWMEGSFRFTRIQYVEAFPGQPDTDYGDYRDKSFDLKLRVLPEQGWWPQVSLGGQDVGGGTEIFSAYYAVASKRLGDFDVTLGWGGERIDGAFGGVRWAPRGWRWSLVAEYDAYDYPNDAFAAQSGVAERGKGAALGLEYRQDYWGVKAYTAHGEAGVNAWLSIPLERREFVPKLDEPAPYTRINPRPAEAQWQDDPAHEARLRRALAIQGYENIATSYRNGRLSASVSNPRISSMPRAVGRAARTMLSFAPLEVRELEVTYVEAPLAFATYTFVDAKTLHRYFNGMTTRERLAPTVDIRYAAPLAHDADQDREAAIAAFSEPLPEDVVVVRDEAPQLLAYRVPLGGGLFRIHPSLSIYFNDPSGAFKADLSAILGWDRRITRGMVFNGDIKATIAENVSDVTQPSNSLLPHVRTDIAQYKAGNEVKLLRAMFNQFYQPATRVYARASAGFYEEMYAGAGGQILYLAPGGGWAADLAVDALRQRDFEGWFGFRDYDTVTAIASLHYRMARGVTATMRGGRFLAKDDGVRFEVKRRFASGFEVGAWYTFTDGNDITSPGSPESPYYDKGVFMKVALDSMVTRDTRAAANLALSPWTRDVGQMVASPGDLARLMEPNVFGMHDLDGLRRFGDMEDDYRLPALGGDARPWPDFVAGDATAFGRQAGRASWVDGLALGAGLVLGAALLDTEYDKLARRYADESWLQNGVKLGDALPIVVAGLSGLFAIDGSRPQLQSSGIAALEASALAVVSTEVLKRAVGRARPDQELGASEFDPFSSDDAYHSFPSRRAAVMWAAVTPYAKEFGMPWLYGLAAVTTFGRAASREHWLSDAVAGSLLGYWLGSTAWEARREARLGRDAPRIGVGVDNVTVAWDF
ncbi:MAG: YjbH domain-containing protein [Betaproteobacteria bacterium]|nr:YjbH domain-containing protein [Betaproteobacteria bacterium]